MKFFHISDLHLGLKLLQRDLLQDQEFILKQIIVRAKEENIDVLVIAGDIYDKPVPPSEAVRVFDSFLTTLKEELPNIYILMISGNHDSSQRIDMYRSILQHEHVYSIGNPPFTPEEHMACVDIGDEYGKVHFYLLPYVRPSMVKNVLQEEGLSYQETIKRMIDREEIDTRERNVFVSHQFYLPKDTEADSIERMDSEIKTVGNIDEVSNEVLAPFDYAALGHIHKPMTVGKQIYRYCGTPIACSVSEAGQQKSILMVEMKEKENITITPIPLHPLHQVKVIKGSLKEILQQSCDDYVSVVLTEHKDHEVFELQNTLRNAFKNLLEISRENVLTPQYISSSHVQEKDPFTLCKEFLPEIEEEEERILKEILNEVEQEEDI